MSMFDEPKVDCHNHVLDPARFPYAGDVAYRPAGQEIGTRDQHRRVMDAYGARHALVVGPNSGYGLDNRCLLDTLAASGGRFKGIAVVKNDRSRDELLALKAAGIVGIAFNLSLLGVAHVTDAAPLLLASGARILIDHCGRATVKLSGCQKFSALPFPFDDTRPYIAALLDAFTPAHCVWASDWPFLRAPERLDVGPLLQLAADWLPDATDRRRVFWDTPRQLFGFAD